MLLGYGGRNFHSFKEDFDVNLTYKGEVLPLLGIKGANASGKTNAIRGLSYITFFMKNSFSNLEPDEGMLAKPFFDSEENIELYIHFKIDGKEYKYEIEFTADMLLKEKFYRKESRWSTICVREGNEIVKCTNELKGLKKMNINRNNVSIISLAHQYGMNDLDIFYTFVEKITTNVDILGKKTNDEYFLGYQTISKLYFEDQNLLNHVGDFLSKADTGICRIEILEIKDEIKDEIKYEPLFHHKVDGKIHKLLYFEESNGTRLIYRQLGLYFLALFSGGVIAIDEFDIGLHPDLSLMLIDLFEDKRINKHGAQLILTSHHSEIIDKLGKYRLIFVNKEENESYLYRLDEISGEILRPDRSIMPAYNSGKIGGRPKVVAYG